MKSNSFWYRVVSGSDPGNAMQSPGYGPGTLLFKSDLHKSYQIQNSSYCVDPEQVVVEPVPIRDLTILQLKQTLYYKKFVNDPLSLWKAYNLLYCSKQMSSGSYVRYKGEVYFVNAGPLRGGFVSLANEKIKETKDVIKVDYMSEKVELISSEEVLELAQNGKNFLPYAIRHCLTQFLDELTMRQIYSLATGEDVEVPVRLIDAKGFHLDTFVFDTEIIQYSHPQHFVIDELPCIKVTYFKKSGEVVFGRTVYKEVGV